VARGERVTRGKETFLLGASQYKAIHYVVKVKLGGVVGLVAPLVGKQPPDSHVWVLGGTAPAFVKAKAPLSAGGPVWRIELAPPVWPTPRAQAEGWSARRRKTRQNPRTIGLSTVERLPRYGGCPGILESEKNRGRSSDKPTIRAQNSSGLFLSPMSQLPHFLPDSSATIKRTSCRCSPPT
jgi:hypothetical protein